MSGQVGHERWLWIRLEWFWLRLQRITRHLPFRNQVGLSRIRGIGGEHVESRFARSSASPESTEMTLPASGSPDRCMARSCSTAMIRSYDPRLSGAINAPKSKAANSLIYSEPINLFVLPAIHR